MKLGLLICGKTGLDALKQLYKSYVVQFVLTDNKSDFIMEFCKKKNIPFFTKNPRKGSTSNFVKKHSIDVLLSVNYIYIIESDLIELPRKASVNIHGSLLPKYKGRSPNVWAIINGEKFTGVTSHLIANECDTGDIIERVKIKIKNDDTGETLLQKLLAQYPGIIEKTLKNIETNKLVLEKQNSNEGSYFGKRTPIDGHIFWGWQKERLYNWVRAQAKPYPGAFCYLNSSKITIHKIRFSKMKYHYLTKDGTIVKVGKKSFFIKTPNGIVEVIEFENPMNQKIEAKMLLN